MTDAANDSNPDMSAPADGPADKTAADPWEAEELIRRFGGIRPMAQKLNIPATTVQGWKKRGVVPVARHAEILRVAAENGISLEPSAKEQVSKTESLPEDSPPEKIASPPVPSSRIEKPPASRRVEKPSPPKGDLAAEKRIVKKAMASSSWVSGVVTAVLIGLAFLLLLPAGEKARNDIDHNGEKIAALEGQADELRAGQESLRAGQDDIREKQGFLGMRIPEDLEDQLSGLKARVDEVSEVAGAVRDDVFAEDSGPLSERIEKLGGHVQTLAGPNGFSDLLSKLQTAQEGVENSNLLGALGAVQAIAGNAQEQAGPNGEISEEVLSSGELTEGVSQTDLKAAALLMGLVQFRSTMNRGAPFSEDLVLLEKVLGDDPDPELQEAIIRLAPQAERGVLSTDGLSSELRGLTGDIVVSSLKGEDVSLKEQALGRLHGVLQVEKDGEPVLMTDTQASVAKAQKALDSGDVATAVAELQKLEGGAAQTAQPVLLQAQNTLAAQEAQQLITQRIMGQIMGGGDLLGGLENITGAVGQDIGSALPNFSGGGRPPAQRAKGRQRYSVAAGSQSSGLPSGLGNLVPSGMGVGAGLPGVSPEVESMLQQLEGVNPAARRIIRNEAAGISILPRARKLEDMVPSQNRIELPGGFQ